MNWKQVAGIWPTLAIRPNGATVNVWHVEANDPALAAALFLEVLG